MRRKAVRKIRLQSAMEYLMTYGWAILIIAVVLGVLFQMGVFNSSSLSVRIPPGACQVLRTSAAVNLVGQCSGILPKYVAQFDGVSSYVNIAGTIGLPMGSAARSVFAWIYVTQNTTRQPIYVYGTSSGDQAVALNVYQGFLSFSTYNHGGNSLLAVSTNAWHFVGFTYAGGTYTSGSMTFYVDGQSSTTWDTPATPNTVVGGVNQIGRWGGVWNYLSGSISNIQLYNTSLSSSQVQALYQEGIGGAPIAPSNIVGWWPLNGDTKDYSGNNNNGAPTAITYVSQYGK